MNKISLFSGIGGDDLASDWAGIKTVLFVEKDKYCQKVLRHHWPQIPIIEDVKDVTYTELVGRKEMPGKTIQSEVKEAVRQDTGDFCSESITTSNPPQSGTATKTSEWRTPQQNIGGEIRDRIRTTRGTNELGIDIISGGFPCQPHSVAGKHKASSDERDLWPEFRRIIGEFNPRWVVAENVPGLFSSDAGRFFRNILRDLAEMGYSAGWCTFGAVDVGAWHRRDRVFIVGYSQRDGRAAGYTQTRRTECESEQGRVCQLTGTGITTNTSGNRSEAGLSEQEQREKGNTEVFNDCGVGNTTVKGLQGAKPAGSVCAIGLSAERRDVPNSTGGRCPQCNTEIGQSSESDSDDYASDSQSQLSNGMYGQRGFTGQWQFGGCPCGARTSGQSEPGMGNVADGIPAWVAGYWDREPDIPRVATGIKDMVNKLKGLGNAVVPFQIYQIYKAIVEIENEGN